MSQDLSQTRMEKDDGERSNNQVKKVLDLVRPVKAVCHLIVKIFNWKNE